MAVKKPVQVVKVKKVHKKSVSYKLTTEDICYLTWHKKFRKEHPNYYNNKGKLSGFPTSNYRLNLHKLYA
jgi:hypothetical protein